MLELTVRLIGSLAVVVGLLLILARFGARKFRGNSAALVHVVHRQPLSRTSAVAVVSVGSRVLVLGTTEQQVSVLAELDPDEIDLPVDAEVLDFPDVELVETPVEATSISTGSMTGGFRAGSMTGGFRTGSMTGGRRPGAHRDTKPVTSAPGPLSGPLSGSVLSPQTWRQAYRSVTGGGARRAS